MKIDILSDLHLDQYFPHDNIVEDAISSIFTPIFTNNSTTKPNDILIIAGDIGHFNKQNIEVLKIFRKLYYKNIVCVLGNHDYYLLDNKIKNQYKNNSFSRVKQMRELINNEDGLYCLDGDVVEIDGVKFGGCDGWYSNAYMKEYFPNKSDKFVLSVWKHTINDYYNTSKIEDFMEMYKIEERKIEKVYQKCDVMITHINPSYKHEHINKAYYNDEVNTFFTFYGHKYLKNGTMKYWVFGHTHDAIEYEIEDVQFLCNPLGYPNESEYRDKINMKSFEII